MMLLVMKDRMENLLKHKIMHQSRLDHIESDLSLRAKAMKGDLKMNETKEERIATLESHSKNLYEARAFISNVCDAYMNLLNKGGK